MLITKRRPASIGEILIEEFMAPIGLTQGALAKAMGVQRKHVNELCNDRRKVTAPTAGGGIQRAADRLLMPPGLSSRRSSPRPG